MYAQAALGQIRYIGVTGKNEKGFRGRIANRHVTGSEGYSHKFSHAHNSGRMWRSRKSHPLQNASDAKAAKDLRTAFIHKYCRATYFVIENPGLVPSVYFTSLTHLEAMVQALAAPQWRSWKGRKFPPTGEPRDLVDKLLDELDWPLPDRRAVGRQAALSNTGLF